MIGVAEYLSTSIAEPCDFSAAFCAAALDEHAAVAHAQRVAGRELRRAAVMAERVGEQQLADMLGSLPPLPQRLDLRDALAAAEPVFFHLLRDEPGDCLLSYAVALICRAISSYFDPIIDRFLAIGKVTVRCRLDSNGQ